MSELIKEQQEKEAKEQKEFDAAWGEETPTEKKVEEPPKEDPTPPEPKADEGTGKETQQETPKEDPIPDPGKTEETEDAKKLREDLEKERQKTRSWEGRIRAANERAKKAEEEAEKLRQQQAKPKEEKPSEVPGDAEEETAVKAFRDEFPDLPKPILALVKKEILPLVRDLVKAELGKIDPVVKDVESIKKHIEVDTTSSHLKAITDAHPDWEKIVSSGDLDVFIESQPSYVRKALEQVKAAGETEEVIDMFSQYKDWKKPQTKPKEPTPPPKDDIKDELAVPASPGGPRIPKKVNKDDFDSAWDEANRQG